MFKRQSASQIEFIAMMASLMAVVALAIDALLPALDVIGITIGTQRPADNQLIITNRIIFCKQMCYGISFCVRGYLIYYFNC